MNYAVIAASIKKTIIGRKTKTIIAALLLAASSAFAQVPSYVPTNGLVGWWPFNGNANDESGNGHNGIVYGAQLVPNRNNVLNSAYSFDGSSMYITCANSNYNLANSISISGWVKVTGVFSQGEQKILSKGIDNTLGHFNMTYSNGPNASVFYGGFNYGTQNQVLGSNQHLPNTGWYHIVFVYDGSLLKLYVNNQLEGSKQYTNSITSINDLLIFGKMLQPTPNYPPYYFKGELDDFGIWNRPLTQNEVSDLYYSCITAPTASITADGPTTFCAGNYVNLNAPNILGASYQWKKNGINISSAISKAYKATATGSYTCYVTNPCGSTTSNAIAVTSKTNASASVTASGATSFCAGDSVTLNCTNLGSNYSVQWYRTNVSMENATAYSQVVKQPGTYKVVTKNLTNGCSRISGSSAIVAVNCRLANPDVIAADITESDFAAKGINEEPKGKIYIYPNPTSDNKFTVELMGLEVDGNATLEVYNGMGQILFSEKVNITNGTLNRTIQIDEQSKGQLCLVRLMAGSEVYDSKVILK